MSDGSDPQPGGPQPGGGQRAHLLIALLACLGVAALLLGGVSLVVHHAVKGPASPYQVAFGTAGDGCDGYSDVKGLVLDQSSGEVLYCGALMGLGDHDGPAGSGGRFSSEEAIRLVELAKSLASEGDGLNDEDEHAVEELAREIGRKHGYEPPTLAVRVTGAFGPYGIGIGLFILIGLGVWGHYKEES